jgi:hypothetical protein
MSHESGCQPHGDQVLCIDPPMCFKPAQWVCAANGPISCQCEVPPPVFSPPIFTPRDQIPVGELVCEVRMQYPVSDPAAPTVMAMGPWCDAAGAELAIAIMLARMLGAR